jgi:hypothetical protein
MHISIAFFRLVEHPNIIQIWVYLHNLGCPWMHICMYYFENLDPIYIYFIYGFDIRYCTKWSVKSHNKQRLGEARIECVYKLYIEVLDHLRV